jgi:hypothetical protein
MSKRSKTHAKINPATFSSTEFPVLSLDELRSIQKITSLKPSEVLVSSTTDLSDSGCPTRPTITIDADGATVIRVKLQSRRNKTTTVELRTVSKRLADEWLRTIQRDQIRDMRHAHSDLLLLNLGSFAPRKFREAWAGDMRQDLNERREAGWSERRLCAFVCWQAFYAAASRFKLHIWIMGAFGVVRSYIFK